MGLLVEHIDKSFDQHHVINDLSMEVKEGSIFGFLVPNGAETAARAHLNEFLIAHEKEKLP